MMRENVKKAFVVMFVLSVFLLSLWNASEISARRHSIKNITKTIELKGEKRLDVRMDIGAGIIDLRKNDTGDILNAEIEYDPDELWVDIDYNKSGDRGRLRLQSRGENDGIDLDKEDNYWFLEFTDKIPISFEIDVGACEADFDFSGLRVDELDLDLGASSVEIDFRKPNPERISEIKIDVGASSLEIHGLGNANFEELSFDGGVGDFTLDFSGESKGSGYCDIEVGLGSLSILVPRDVGVQIKAESSFLSSVDIDEDDFDEIEDDLYENDNFGRTEREFIFNIEVGLGSVDVKYTD
jgi:hypothetical protein